MNWSSPETRSFIYRIAGVLTFFSILGRVLRLRRSSPCGNSLRPRPSAGRTTKALFPAFFAALPYQYVLVHIGWYGMFLILILVYAFVLLPCLPVVRGDTQDFLARTARTQWGLMVSTPLYFHIMSYCFGMD